MRRVHKEEIWDPSYPARRRSRDAGPASRSRTRPRTTARCCCPRRGRCPGRHPPAPAARLHVARGHVPVLVRQPRARAPDTRDHPGGVPRRRARVAVARGHGGRTRVRAGVDDAGQRVRRAAHRPLHVAPRRATARRGLRGTGADHAGDRGRDAARLRRQARRHVARIRADGRRHGIRRAARAADAADFIAVDMGGTSFDICLVRGGRPEVRTDRTWRYRYYIGIPMVDVRSVGAGGGSIAACARARCSSVPSPPAPCPAPPATDGAAPTPTVTDADCVLGYLPTEGFAGGRMTLDTGCVTRRHRARRREPLGIDVVEAAWGIERIVNANMANAMRRVLVVLRRRPARARGDRVRRQRPTARVRARDRARLAARSSSPKAAPAFSALGLLVADYVVDLAPLVRRPDQPGRPRPAATR